eukprot:scaffold261902_cov49-Prasinocladus_malaysianus.AAC.1
MINNCRPLNNPFVARKQTAEITKISRGCDNPNARCGLNVYNAMAIYLQIPQARGDLPRLDYHKLWSALFGCTTREPRAGNI